METSSGPYSQNITFCLRIGPEGLRRFLAEDCKILTGIKNTTNAALTVPDDLNDVGSESIHDSRILRLVGVADSIHLAVYYICHVVHEESPPPFPAALLPALRSLPLEDVKEAHLRGHYTALSATWDFFIQDAPSVTRGEEEVYDDQGTQDKVSLYLPDQATGYVIGKGSG